jgi:hypothetical protein
MAALAPLSEPSPALQPKSSPLPLLPETGDATTQAPAGKTG